MKAVIIVIHDEQKGVDDADENTDDELGESRWFRKACLAYRTLLLAPADKQCP